MDEPNRLWRIVRRVLKVFAALAFCIVLAFGVLLSFALGPLTIFNNN
jgi:hypothetical protein